MPGRARDKIEESLNTSGKWSLRAEGKMKPEARKTAAVQILLLKHPVGPKGEMKKKTFHSTLYVVRVN